tara:strand:- start:1105 stop:1281 length:177 start_codon:yes stop_codon:yes gene_type:complete
MSEPTTPPNTPELRAQVMEPNVSVQNIVVIPMLMLDDIKRYMTSPETRTKSKKIKLNT